MVDEQDSVAGQGLDEPQEQPLCWQCLTPFDLLQHYCHKCGATVGQFTPYIPFVNIRFQANFFGKMWRRIWYEKATPATKVVCLLLILFLWPIMLLLGLPFVFWRWLRKRGDEQRANPRVQSDAASRSDDRADGQ